MNELGLGREMKNTRFVHDYFGFNVWIFYRHLRSSQCCDMGEKLRSGPDAQSVKNGWSDK